MALMAGDLHDLHFGQRRALKKAAYRLMAHVVKQQAPARRPGSMPSAPRGRWRCRGGFVDYSFHSVVMIVSAWEAPCGRT